MEGRWGASRCGSLARCVASVVLAGLATIAAAAPSRAEPFLRPSGSSAGAGVAVLAKGAVWSDGYQLRWQGFSSPGKVLGGLHEPDPFLASSANAVALAGRGFSESFFSAAVPPDRFAPIGQVWAPVRGAGCEWLPWGTAEPREFVVAGNQLVDGGDCAEEMTFQAQLPKQPLFVRDVRGGNWHVLRWLSGRATPVLAAEGEKLAVGVGSSTRRMHVVVFDLPSTKPIAQFDAPAGYLGFASPTRLIDSVLVPLHPHEAKAPPLIEPFKRRVPHSYSVELYSLDGRRLAALGTFGEPPLASHMHLLSVEGNEGESRLVLRSIADGRARPLVGFSEPVRSLEGFAFRWPAVAFVERTSVPRVQSEVTCTSGEYKPPEPPTLLILDLARAEPFLPAPPRAHLAPPAGTCPVHVIAYEKHG
jgi:hypothetical protein